MNTTLRYNEYYDMQDTFDNLYEGSKNNNNFHKLYDIITSENNILLAYRTIKSNKGSKTSGTDKMNIDDLKSMDKEELISLIRNKLNNYKPDKVKRVFIPKANGDKRPLGIPSITDRIIQQCFKQVLEPICEAKFYNHSYGFRPNRSTHHALGRAKFLINKNKLHYVVDVDIKGFFDNVNHRKLIKSMYNLGIKDKKVLTIINKMLKAEIEGEGIPDKGTPQGGILSPLLSNIVLNELDSWIYSQWEGIKTKHEYKFQDAKTRALRKTKLKEGFIVRYADDFKIFCRSWKDAYKWYHAVIEFLNKRLGLEVSKEKTKVINLRKNSSKFLGFTLKAVKKKNKRVCYSHIDNKKKKEIINNIKELTKNINKCPTKNNIDKYNQYILGIHEYFKYATHITLDMRDIFYKTKNSVKNKLKKRGSYGKINDKDKTELYKKRFKNNYKVWKINNTILYPIQDIKTNTIYNFNQSICNYTKDGRTLIYKSFDRIFKYELNNLRNNKISKYLSVEFEDNKLSRYSMCKGKCEITGVKLKINEVECHHIIPRSLNGSDSFDNLKIIHKEIHQLIHLTDESKIKKLLSIWKFTDKQLNKINELRNRCNLYSI